MAPYDKRSGAGSKTHNYYVKKIKKDNSLSLKLLSFEYNPTEYQAAIDDMKAYGIDGDICIRDMRLLPRIFRLVRNIPSKYFPWDKNGNFTSQYYRENIISHLTSYRNSGFVPNVIIVEWTQVVLFIEDIKKIYPDAKTVAIEVDVSFQGLQRKVLNENKVVKKYIKKLRYQNLKKSELLALSQYDLVYTQNPKDRNLLISSGIEENKVLWFSPWYERFSKRIEREVDYNNPYIVFYGTMSRPENYLSAIWFIHNVLPKLDETITFYIVGSKPAEQLKKYSSNKVIITGFLEDVSSLFAGCLCMTAPLVLGAGIKVKILEAMSAGIPVLTNVIGIEGINVSDGEDFYMCNEPDDYARIVNHILNREIDAETVAQNARKTVLELYDYNKTSDAFLNTIKTL